MKKRAMKVVWLTCMFLSMVVNYPAVGHLTSKAMSQPLVFNNVLDFNDQEFTHISFDPADEHTPESIVQKFGNISSFTIDGGLAAIRPGSDYAGNFPGEGTEGGPVSGNYRVDWGYFARSAVTITFIAPVDAVGAFYGGNNVAGGSQLIVMLADGTTFATDGQQAGLANVADFLPSPTGECTAINGFLGVDSNGGPGIVKVIFTTSNDAASLDSIFYGTAEGGSHGPGVIGFPKNPFGPQCAAAGFPAQPVFPSPVKPPCITAPNGIVSWWPAEDNGNDIVGGHHAMLLNGVSYAPGKVGKAFSFDGIDDVIRTPLMVSYATGVTFELWLKTTDDLALVMADTGTTEQSGMGLFLEEGGKIYFLGYKSTPGINNFDQARGPFIADGRFHHVAATWTGDTSVNGVKLYVDGVLVATDTAATTIAGGSGPLHLGWSTIITGNNRLNGLIDEATVYNRALSAQEILSIYRAGGGGKCQLPVDCNPDVTAPVITAPSDITLTLPANAGDCALLISDSRLGNANVTDNCGAAVQVERIGVPAGNRFPVGTTPVTYIATDAAGNRSTAVQKLTVIDATPPTITAPPDVSVNTAAGALACEVFISDVNLGQPMVSDLCPTSITRSGVPAGNLFPLGKSTVNYTVTDASGNTAVATQTVTVIDKTAPTIVAPPDLTVATGPGATACAVFISDDRLGKVTARDNCTMPISVERAGVPANNIFPVGTTVITYTAADNNGNTTTVSQKVIVVDNTPPTISCPMDITVMARCGSASSVVTFAAPIVNDNCMTATVVCAPSSGTSFSVGTTTVTCTATDSAGNNAACSFTITVQLPQQAINDLVAQIQLLGLPKGTENSLTAKLRAARDSVDDCSGKEPVNQLEAFIKQVNALRNKELTDQQADMLVAAAQRIISGL